MIEIQVFLVFWTGIILGILHTIMPCEDKAIFCFYAFGVSRDWKQAIGILNLYGLGLFLTNLLIGSVISYFGAAAGVFIRQTVNQFVWNLIGGLSLILSGILMIIQLHTNRYRPHNGQWHELGENLVTLKSRKRTAFLLGIFAGIPPCIFEFAIYVQAINLSVNYGWGNGSLSVFFFGIGTWLGLFPLALLGTASGKISKFMQQNMLQRQIRTIKQIKKTEAKDQSLPLQTPDPITQNESNREKPQNLGEKSKVNSESNPLDQHSKTNVSKSRISYKLEFFSASALILLGLIFSILAILKISIFVLDSPINPPPPFNIS